MNKDLSTKKIIYYTIVVFLKKFYVIIKVNNNMY